MDSFLNLLFYRHRRIKGETYFRNRFPFMFAIAMFLSFFIVDSLNGFLICVVAFMFIDMLLAFGAWIYYKTDL